jgi:hypothetical protein
MDDALGLVGDHFDDDLDGGLEAARHAGSGAGGEAGHDEHAEQAEADGEEQGIEVEDRPVDQANLFLVGEEGQVVDDVFGCGGSVLGSHVQNFLLKSANRFALRATTRPAINASQCRSRYRLAAAASNARVAATFMNSPNKERGG